MYIVRGCPVVVFIAPFKDIFLDAIRVWTPYVSYKGNGGCGEVLHATSLLHAPPEITLHATCYMQAGDQSSRSDASATDAMCTPKRSLLGRWCRLCWRPVSGDLDACEECDEECDEASQERLPGANGTYRIGRIFSGTLSPHSTRKYTVGRYRIRNLKILA